MVLLNVLTTSDCAELAGRGAVSACLGYVHVGSCHHMFCLLVSSVSDRVQEHGTAQGRRKHSALLRKSSP